MWVVIQIINMRDALGHYTERNVFYFEGEDAEARAAEYAMNTTLCPAYIQGRPAFYYVQSATKVEPSNTPEQTTPAVDPVVAAAYGRLYA